MSIALNVSDEITEYRDSLEKGLMNIETELNNIKIVLTPISKNQISRVEKLIRDCENNVIYL
jgi:hypothetical protein